MRHSQTDVYVLAQSYMTSALAVMEFSVVPINSIACVGTKRNVSSLMEMPSDHSSLRRASVADWTLWRDHSNSSHHGDMEKKNQNSLAVEVNCNKCRHFVKSLGAVISAKGRTFFR